MDNTVIDVETKAAFVAVDEDNDGLITYDELRACLRQLTGVKKLPDKIITQVLEDADQNKSGNMNYEEFSNAIGTCTLLETIIVLFIKCDKDKSGFITPDELTKYVDDLPECSRDKINVDKVLKQCDLNDDGYISFEEFANHMFYDIEEEGGHLMGH